MRESLALAIETCDLWFTFLSSLWFGLVWFCNVALSWPCLGSSSSLNAGLRSSSRLVRFNGNAVWLKTKKTKQCDTMKWNWFPSPESQKAHGPRSTSRVLECNREQHWLLHYNNPEIRLRNHQFGLTTFASTWWDIPMVEATDDNSSQWRVKKHRLCDICFPNAHA